MKTYTKGKRISKEKAEEMLGKERLQARIKDAQQSFMENPLQLITWMEWK